MAEAHAAVAFQFTVTHEGVNLHINNEALLAVIKSGIRSWKKRYARFRNHLVTSVYPASPASWLVVVTAIYAIILARFDPSLGMIDMLSHKLPIEYFSPPADLYISTLIFATVLWIILILVIQYVLKLLLVYKGWMWEPITIRNWTILSKIWLCLIRVFGGREPMLFSYQQSLPKLPLPALDKTMSRYLRSVRPLCTDEEFTRITNLVHEFEHGLGKKLQRYLLLKSWWSSNYVTDWWEDYVYLAGRGPIMINSNFYGTDSIACPNNLHQAARAANLIHGALQFRRQIDRETLKPLRLKGVIPLCSGQYERTFNTTRIPGEEKDSIAHWKDSRHIVVYHDGRFFKVNVYHKGSILKPCELELQLQRIIDCKDEPQNGEFYLGALTASDRKPWAYARKRYFSHGVNKRSLDIIDKAAFYVCLDDAEPVLNTADESSCDEYVQLMLHGKGYNRWFDKSFQMIVFKNARAGFNGEHSWADAPIIAHMWEYAIAHDFLHYSYNDTGHTRGVCDSILPTPAKLQWNIPDEATEVIHQSLKAAQVLIDDTDIVMLPFNGYGKGFMKKCKCSPDGYIQLALQLACFKDLKQICLTYEASMTRLWREGRTETVRSCTTESCNFVRAMNDPSVSDAERRSFLKSATDYHQKLYRSAMCGDGIDRHLFCLYVVSKYLNEESPFLKEVLSEPWKLSTSQTPHQQTNLMDLKIHADQISGGGGFGPVADCGYGVSYIIAGEDVILFHISSRRRSSETDSNRFRKNLNFALMQMKSIFEPLKPQ